MKTLSLTLPVLLALALSGLSLVCQAQMTGLPTDAMGLDPRAARKAPGAPLEDDPSALMGGQRSGVAMPVTLDESGSQGGALELEGHASRARPPFVPVEQPIDPDTYLCGPGDVFQLDFWGQQTLRLSLTVDLEGRAYVHGVGFVSVAGKSLSEVRSQVKQKVRRQYPGLSFELSLARPRQFLVHVVDHVQKPATYVAQPTERVSSVLERAGATGSRRRIVIRRTNGSEVRADLVMYERTGDPVHNPLVLDGDVIKVPYPEVVVSIEGPVQRPGKYELIDTRDLAEALMLSGGFTSLVARKLPIQLIRRDAALREVASDLAFTEQGAAPNHPLADDDRIVVRSAREVDRTVLLIGPVEGAERVDGATSTRRLQFVEGDSVRTILERAGGVKAQGDLRKAYISRSGDGKEPTHVAIDLEALLVRRDYAADRSIQIGDEIVIPPMRRGIMVEGAVVRAGIYPYDPSFGVPEFIASAGGRTRTARSMGSVTLIHSDGKTEPYKQGKRPQVGDTILVPERNFSRSEVVSLVISGAGLVLGALTLVVVSQR
jgi:polysaccharide export outer membrane protein